MEHQYLHVCCGDKSQIETCSGLDKCYLLCKKHAFNRIYSISCAQVCEPSNPCSSVDQEATMAGLYENLYYNGIEWRQLDLISSFRRIQIYIYIITNWLLSIIVFCLAMLLLRSYQSVPIWCTRVPGQNCGPYMKGLHCIKVQKNHLHVISSFFS